MEYVLYIRDELRMGRSEELKTNGNTVESRSAYCRLGSEESDGDGVLLVVHVNSEDNYGKAIIRII